MLMMYVCCEMVVYYIDMDRIFGGIQVINY